jgi:hypothetical protein
LQVWQGIKERKMQSLNAESSTTALLTSIVLNALNSLGGNKSKPVEVENLLPYPDLQKATNPYLKIVSPTTRKFILKAQKEGKIPAPMMRLILQNKELWEVIVQC